MIPGALAKKSSGFSLLELIVVLIIVGLASTLAAPRIQDFIEEARIRTGARKMAALLRYARNQALFSKQVVTVTADESGRRWWIKYSELQAGERWVNLPKGVRGKVVERYFSALSNAKGSILFSPKGESTGQLVEIYDGRGRKFQLAVDPVIGSVTLARGS